MTRVTAVCPESGDVGLDQPVDLRTPAAPVAQVAATGDSIGDQPEVQPDDDPEERFEGELSDQLEEELGARLADQLAGRVDEQTCESVGESEVLREIESAKLDGPDDASRPEDDLGPLLAQARAGDRSAFARLHRRLDPLIAAIAARYRPYLPRGVDVEDLRQEMAVRLHDSLAEFDPARGDAFLAYLRLDLRRHVSSFLRVEARRSGRNAAQRDRLISLARSASYDPFALAPDLTSPRLRSALAQLRPGQRAVIAGIYWRDRQTRELASELHLTVQAVTAARRRAEAKLREALSEPAEPGVE